MKHLLCFILYFIRLLFYGKELKVVSAKNAMREDHQEIKTNQ